MSVVDAVGFLDVVTAGIFFAAGADGMSRCRLFDAGPSSAQESNSFTQFEYTHKEVSQWAILLARTPEPRQ